MPTDDFDPAEEDIYAYLCTEEGMSDVLATIAARGGDPDD